MTSTPSPPQHQVPPESNKNFPIDMGRAIRTPSPLPQALFYNKVTTDEAGPRSTADICLKRVDMAGSITLGDHDALPELGTPSTTVVPQPRTPPAKRVKPNWNGLPSPQTPSHIVDISTYQPADLRSGGQCSTKESFQSVEEKGRMLPQGTAEATVGHVDTPTSPSSWNAAASFDSGELSALLRRSPSASSTSIEVDAELAISLSSPSTIRRSTRLRNKAKTQEEPRPIPKSSKQVTQASLTLLQEPVQQVFTSAEPTASPFEVAIYSGDELPIAHSTQWQLMYPPGGSTHPSYPWPTADPRLVFQPHQVPLRNGLPDVSYVPGLMLPIGWRQVCWSGLCPVVFDPSHQAFKLTPVGPLPLTCEEVHQGGLQEYIPGGKSHPEFGLLPQLYAFSDGSDYEVFNFEGVDWKLPWSNVEGVPDVGSAFASSPFGSDNMLSTTLTTSVSQLKPHYLEARDCPDHVIDLEDAWRWLKGLDPNSTAAFESTPGKCWRGTGIPLTPRKTKQPIASLMALTMTDKGPCVGHYLVKQDRREFCPFKSVATPVHIDIALLQDVEFTIMELLCYFPSHYQWRGGADRLTRSGMSSSDIANLINMVRRLPSASTCKASTVDGYIWWDRQEDGTRVRVEPSDNEVIDYTAEHWSSLIWEKQDYPFLAIAHGLLELPSGPDAGPITALIKWCRENDRYQVMLSDVPALLKEANIESLIDPGNGVDPDKEFLSRHAEAMRIDRKRVIKEKKDMDAGKEKNSRKRMLE